MIGLEKIHGREGEDGRQYLTFELGGQEYDVGISTSNVSFQVAISPP